MYKVIYKLIYKLLIYESVKTQPKTNSNLLFSRDLKHFFGIICLNHFHI